MFSNIVINLKKKTKKFLPVIIINILKRMLVNYNLIKYKNLDNRSIFHNIYQTEAWGKKNLDKNIKYNSGPGTQNKEFVEEYLNSLSNFLINFEEKPSIADLGCGNFEIGSKIVRYSSKFFAIDIFEDLIEFNKEKFFNMNVEFLNLDITEDNLPYADIYIIRTVLQHLSNKSIIKFISNIKNKCKYLIVTEHLPDKNIKNFKPNQDIISGPYIRLFKNSGVVLTEKPFNLEVKKKKILNISSSKNTEGVLNTTLLKII